MGFNFTKHCDKIDENEVLLAYKGSVTAEIITNTLSLVESKIENTTSHTITKKKVYNVLVESLQNLFHHVDDAPIELGLSTIERKHYGMFALSLKDGKFRIFTGNFIKNEHIEKLKAKIDKVNNLSKEELKDFYKEVLNNQRFSAKGGGGLGLIDIARKTGNKLTYEFDRISDQYSFFSLEVFIKDKNNN